MAAKGQEYLILERIERLLDVQLDKLNLTAERIEDEVRELKERVECIDNSIDDIKQSKGI